MRFRCLLATLMILPAPALFGQAAATVQGTVTDASGALVPRVQITVIREDTGLRRTTQSNDAGNYSVPALQPACIRSKPNCRVSASR